MKGRGSRTRAFRLPLELDKRVEEKALKEGYTNPSEFIRELVRMNLKEEASPA